MPGIVALFTIGVLALVLAISASGYEPGQAGSGSHRELNTIVTKIASGVVFVQPFEGLRPRTISPAKADRVGLHETKPGDKVTLVVDEGTVLIDAHKADLPFVHRLVAGNLNYADAYWGEIQLSSPEGTTRFDVDSLAGSKLSVLSEGTPVIIELDEDNMMIDIHRAR
ncbi:MAG: hypothetical protein C4293_07105 [Nitrospiraceae bacterium]